MAWLSTTGNAREGAVVAASQPAAHIPADAATLLIRILFSTTSTRGPLLSRRSNAESLTIRGTIPTRGR